MASGQLTTTAVFNMDKWNKITFIYDLLDQATASLLPELAIGNFFIIIFYLFVYFCM